MNNIIDKSCSDYIYMIRQGKNFYVSLRNDNRNHVFVIYFYSVNGKYKNNMNNMHLQGKTYPKNLDSGKYILENCIKKIGSQNEIDSDYIQFFNGLQK